MKSSGQRFIVVPKSRKEDRISLLREILAEIEKTPGVSVERVVGGADKMRRIEISGSEEQIGKLRSRYDDRLIIEPDRDLQLLE